MIDSHVCFEIRQGRSIAISRRRGLDVPKYTDIQMNRATRALVLLVEGGDLR
jgi:hypothetical protein